MNETIRVTLAALFIVVGGITVFFSWLAVPAVFLHVLLGGASITALGILIVARGE